MDPRYFTFIMVLCCVGHALTADKPTTEKKKEARSLDSDLKTDSSQGLGYGIGYGQAYPYHGWGGLSNYGGHTGGKGFVLPVFNYGIGGLGYGAYGLGSYPYGYSNVLLGHAYGQPYGSSYYSHPYGRGYFSGPYGK